MEHKQTRAEERAEVAAEKAEAKAEKAAAKAAEPKALAVGTQVTMNGKPCKIARFDHFDPATKDCPAQACYCVVFPDGTTSHALASQIEEVKKA